MKPILSMSGVEMNVCDEDRILIAIGEAVAGPAYFDIDGMKIVGAPNAYGIKRAIEEAGFEIVRKEPLADE